MTRVINVPIWDFDETCHKYYVIVFNMIFTCSGMFMIGLGICILINLNRFSVLCVSCVCNIPWVVVAFGIIIVACGCTSYLIMRRSILLFLYSSCLFVLFIFGIILALGVACYDSRIKETVGNGISLHMENYKNWETDKIMDTLQTELECCGKTDPTDWFSTSTGQVPPSCCKIKLCDPTKQDEIYSEGCFPKLMDYINSYERIIHFTAIIGSFLPLIGTVLLFSYAYKAVATKYQEV